MATTPDKLLDNSSAAEMLGCSAATVVALRNRGEIPFIRLQNSRKGYRYSRNELEKFITERLQRARQENQAKAVSP